MNERRPTWNCPVCDKPANYENLVIDGCVLSLCALISSRDFWNATSKLYISFLRCSYFQEVLSSSSLPTDINEITLLKDGSWTTSSDSQAEMNTLDTPRKSSHKVEVISDDIGMTADDPSNAETIPYGQDNSMDALVVFLCALCRSNYS